MNKDLGIPRRLPLDIAVIGTGISGMACAWLLSKEHRVSVYEKDGRFGGHSHTVEVAGPDGPVPVDTGFIVYNEVNYPNLTALFDHLGVPTQASDMSFAVSLDGGRLEYSGSGLGGVFAQHRNLLRPRFWGMLRDLLRFYRAAPAVLTRTDRDEITLGELLEEGGYTDALTEDHLLPMAAAIWSTPIARVRDYPAGPFIRFCDNHGLLRLRDRPRWRTVAGGSRSYVERLTAAYRRDARLGAGVRAVRRVSGGVVVHDDHGGTRRYDHVVIAAHADQALGMLDHPTREERALLGAFRYERNVAVLHGDTDLMPRRRRTWSSWNYLGDSSSGQGDAVSVTYWMNRLQGIDPRTPLFVSLNPIRPPRRGTEFGVFHYDHPVFDASAVRARKRLWSLQGVGNVWYCGAHFGDGFHEDGLQAGLAVAEGLGGVRRPWSVENESGRIELGAGSPAQGGFAERKGEAA